MIIEFVLPVDCTILETLLSESYLAKLLREDKPIKKQDLPEQDQMRQLYNLLYKNYYFYEASKHLLQGRWPVTCLLTNKDEIIKEDLTTVY